MESKKEIKAWKEVKLEKRFLNAFRGLYVFYMTSKHFYLIIFSIVFLSILGFFLDISHIEWIALVFSIGFVLVSEVLNTAIEIDIDLTSPEYHPFARDTKDVAAAAVFLSIITSSVIALIIFLPKIISLYIR